MSVDERVLLIVGTSVRQKRALRLRVTPHVLRPRPVELRLAADVPHLGQNLARRSLPHALEQLGDRNGCFAVRIHRAVRVLRSVREDQDVGVGEHRREGAVVVVRPVHAELEGPDALDAVRRHQLLGESLPEGPAGAGHGDAPVAQRDGGAEEPVEDAHHGAEVVLRVDVVQGVVLGADEEEVRVLGDARVGDVVGVVALVPRDDEGADGLDGQD